MPGTDLGWRTTQVPHYDVHNVYAFVQSKTTADAMKVIRKERTQLVSRGTFPAVLGHVRYCATRPLGHIRYHSTPLLDHVRYRTTPLLDHVRYPTLRLCSNPAQPSLPDHVRHQRAELTCGRREWARDGTLAGRQQERVGGSTRVAVRDARHGRARNPFCRRRHLWLCGYAYALLCFFPADCGGYFFSGDF
eukprot:1470431-Rhodomonas_salina.3